MSDAVQRRLVPGSAKSEEIMPLSSSAALRASLCFPVVVALPLIDPVIVLFHVVRVSCDRLVRTS